ncbi:MAG: regulatory protein RecX, partial [Deltaproteobacteria bacterium]
MARQPKAPPDAWQLALRLLTRRDYSSCELTARLRQRGCPQEEIEKALDRLQQLGYLDDRRYAQ